MSNKALSGELMHTPTPWFIRVVDEHELIITDEIGNTTLASFDRKYEESERANAEFIVTACNAYYKLKEDKVVLLEACKEIVKYMKNETNNPLVVYNKVNQAIEKANG